MPYQDADVRGGKVCLKNSMVAAETIAADGLVPGELALNAADGAMYFRTNAGAVGQFPSASGFLRIQSLSQSAYDGLVATTATNSQTLYIVTAS